MTREDSSLSWHLWSLERSDRTRHAQRVKRARVELDRQARLKAQEIAVRRLVSGTKSKGGKGGA